MQGYGILLNKVNSRELVTSESDLWISTYSRKDTQGYELEHHGSSVGWSPLGNTTAAKLYYELWKTGSS